MIASSPRHGARVVSDTYNYDDAAIVIPLLPDDRRVLLGWNDIAERCPVHPSELASLARMRPHVVPPLASSRFLSASPIRHTYNFYRKPAAVLRDPQRTAESRDAERRSIAKGRMQK
jgi:hypothetical protein